MPTANVLIVDDEPDLVELVELTLQRMGLHARSAGTLRDAQVMALAEPFDLVLCDMRLPDGNGLDLVEWLQAKRPGLPCAVITAHGNVETAVRARMISSALKLSERPEGDGVTFRGPRLLGQSEPMRQLRGMIARVARSQAPVHISGESGTGKELVARLIHLSGPRADAPFIAVNCGAIPGELMESELFGHKRGSFTGAVADKKGLIETAEGGTLFLDEVADLPLHMQVKLLRVIQEKTLRPVGGTGEVTVDVRLLSATHKDLAELVALGKFREDLFYRINVIEIRVPALRERAGDIPEIAEHILRRLARRSGGTSVGITPEALLLLQGHDYPGNVRELENILERAITLSPDGQVRPEDIQLRSVARADSHSVPEVSGIAAAQPAGPATRSGAALGSQLEVIERDAIVQALEKTRYNKTAAAQLLGMSFRALRYRIKKLGIE
jgi:two-component system response regulator PilR (NtrC family)